MGYFCSDQIGFLNAWFAGLPPEAGRISDFLAGRGLSPEKRQPLSSAGPRSGQLRNWGGIS